MCRAKWTSRLRGFVCLLSACGLSVCGLSGCGEEQKKSEVLLYKGDDVKKEEQSFETVQVKKGTYKETVSTTASLYYPDENQVSIDESNAYLDKICVKKNQKVRKGDIVAYYHIKTSKSSMEKKKLLMNQAKSQYEAQLRSKQGEILAQEKLVRSLPGKAEKKLAQIDLKRMKKEYKQLVTSGKDVRKQEKEYLELVRKQKKTPLKSEYSGTVVKPVSVSDYGDESVTGETLMKIRNESDVLIQTDGEGGDLRYNMTVDIGLGSTTEDIKYHIKGKVISTDNLSSGSSSDEEGGSPQLIKISRRERDKYNLKKYNLFVTGVILRIDDALLVDSRAVYEETEEEDVRRYVMLVENGKLHKRYIVSNYQQDKTFLVNQGVEEGQTLAVLKQ